MLNDSFLDYRPLEESLSVYKRLTGLDHDRYDMYSHSEHVIDQCKGLDLVTYVLQSRVDEKGNVKLPCDVYQIRSVTGSVERSIYEGWGFIAMPGTTYVHDQLV